MKAMILAAGMGTRMLPLTQNCPKPLLRVAGIPLLEHWLTKLERVSAITHIIINAAYLSEHISAYINSRHNTVPIRVNIEPEPLETAGALHAVLPYLGQEPFLLINGDVFCDAPMDTWLEGASRCLQANTQCEGFFMMVDNPSHNTTGDFCIASDGLLIAKPEQSRRAGHSIHTSHSSYTFSGLSLLRPRLISAYPQARKKFALREVFDWAMARHGLYAGYYSGYWLDVGTPERLRQLEQDVQARPSLLAHLDASIKNAYQKTNKRDE